jgi:sialate O-acetylesterase
MNRIFLLIALFISFMNIYDLKAEIRLPGFFTHYMVLQRDAPVRIWGWADKSENVEIAFSGQKIKTRADKTGRWEIFLKEMTAGGPFTLIVKGKDNQIEVNDILIGDVWYCGGQSNMEMKLKECYNQEEEIHRADYPLIRSLRVPKVMNTSPQDDFRSNWEVCSSTTAGDFSAVGYFFARDLFLELNVPIGILNVSWGGTGIEAWTGKKALLDLPEEIFSQYSPALDDSFEENYNMLDDSRNAYREAVKFDPGIKERWFEHHTDCSNWNEIDVPAQWSRTEIGEIIGNVWYKNQIVIAKKDVNKPAILSLGIIDDNDETWVNGIKIGSTIRTSRRLYQIPQGVLKEGINSITVLLHNISRDGGMLSDGYKYYLQVEGKDTKIPLSGKWKYKKSVSNRDYNYVESYPNPAPTLLYNSMTHPLTKFRMKGVIWYQGEHNVENAYEYRTLFPNLINSWRKEWGYDFPFYWVQLANLMELDKTPKESNWAELREAQSMTLSVPKTGQAVIYDIGDAEDVHPKNKKDVGKRLSLIALHKDYGKNDIVFSGPTFHAIEVKGNKIIISFDNIGTGLQSSDKYGYVKGFAIAGKDRMFKWAKAYIENGQVIVYNENIAQPVAVRYAWGNNTDAGLFNKEGLPAIPFRTDNWKLITEK